MLCLKRIPHFTTLQKFVQRTSKQLFEVLVRVCRKLLNLKNIEVSIDGTGFSNTNPSHYYCKRINSKIVKNYTKTVFLTDDKTKLILNVRTYSNNKHEITLFKQIVKQIARNLKTVIANKAYDSKTNRNHCTDNGIEPVIPVRQYSKSRTEVIHPSKRYTQTINKTVYNHRALLESVNLAIKRTLGAYTNNRLVNTQQKQVTIKALAYNIEHINRTIKISILLKTQ